jgi:hypothetical protein
MQSLGMNTQSQIYSNPMQHFPMLVGLETLGKDVNKDEQVITMGGLLNRLDSGKKIMELNITALPRMASILMRTLLAFSSVMTDHT